MEYKSAFVSLFASRILYSLQDYSRVKNLEDSILSRKENEFPPKITDQNALFYLYSLKGDAQYRSSDLSGAVLSYGEALRILEDERVENNRKFILEKLKKPEPPKPEPKKVEPPKPEPPKSEPPKETKSATGSKSETESSGKSGQNEVK